MQVEAFAFFPFGGLSHTFAFLDAPVAFLFSIFQKTQLRIPRPPARSASSTMMNRSLNTSLYLALSLFLASCEPSTRQLNTR